MKCPKCQSTHIIRKGLSQPLLCLHGHKRQRFLCKHCLHRFCSSALNLNFRLKNPDLALNSKIFFFAVRGLSNRQIALALKVSEGCIRIRLQRLAQRAFIFHSQALDSFQITEPIAYDGLENFAQSQYNPNNINHAIGQRSLFIYDFNFSPLNRKGFMSDWQRRKLKNIEMLEGRYNPKAIRLSSKKIFERLISKAGPSKPLELLSDEHFQYKRALADIPRIQDLCEHKTISSKAYRDFKNILFSVNHVDLMLRQRVAAFARETISFSKTAARMCQKYSLYMVYKNYMIPQFTKKHVRRPYAHEQSPAQDLGLTHHLLSYADIFNEYPHTNTASKYLNPEWMEFFKGQVPEDCLRNKKYLRSRAC